MRAAVIRRHGGPDAIRVETVPTPRPGPGELLVRVAAVGLNRLDVFARQGLQGPGVPLIRLPHVSGVDVAGTVAEHGPGVDTPPPGNWQDFLAVTRLIFRGTLVPVVDAVFPLDRVAEAQTALERREHFGKIVVKVAPDNAGH
jgi:NADPH:quinone reductase-like Zn-dependent oxidoreductase